MTNLRTALISLARSIVGGGSAPAAPGAEVLTPSRANVEKVLSGWKYEEAVKQARLTLDKHGLPDEMTGSMLLWNNRGPWKRITVQNMHLLHNFPVPHHDFIAHVAPYKVNVDKASDCFRFDTSIVIEVTAGEIGSRCHFEGANTITTNLIHDIMQGRMSWQAAQKFMYDAVTKNSHPGYMSRLQFRPPTEEAAHNPSLPYPEQAKGRAKGP
jgi:hypothetical protein